MTLSCWYDCIKHRQLFSNHLSTATLEKDSLQNKFTAKYIAAFLLGFWVDVLGIGVPIQEVGITFLEGFWKLIPLMSSPANSVYFYRIYLFIWMYQMTCSPHACYVEMTMQYCPADKCFLGIGCKLPNDCCCWWWGFFSSTYTTKTLQITEKAWDSFSVFSYRSL